MRANFSHSCPWGSAHLRSHLPVPPRAAAPAQDCSSRGSPWAVLPPDVIFHCCTVAPPWQHRRCPWAARRQPALISASPALQKAAAQCLEPPALLHWSTDLQTCFSFFCFSQSSHILLESTSWHLHTVYCSTGNITPCYISVIRKSLSTKI